ncbi:MAG: VCBS repeat-containing protein, partial [Candidatus Caldarchaeum sp.]
SFVNYSPIFTGTRFYPCIALGDVDSDGDVDVAYANTGLRASTTQPYVVALLRNQGNGTLQAPTGIALGEYTGSFDSVAVRDVNGDGRPEILGTLGSNQGWGVLPNTGSGNFGAFQRYATAEYPHDVNPADVDRDNDMDVVLTNWMSIEVSVHINPGNGNFATPIAADLLSGVYTGLEEGDVNNDGRLDVVIGSNPLQVYIGNGTGGFTLRGQFPLGNTRIQDLRLKDMDNDGYLDVIFNESSTPYRWGICWNDHTGGFSAATLYSPETCGYANAEIEAADLDNDGDLDVILPEDLGCPGIPQSARRVFIIENRGNRNFQLHSVITTNPWPGSIKAGDLDRDGKMDIAIGNPWLDVLWGNGDLTFTRTSVADLPILELTLTDVNNDGRIDILTGLNRQEPYRESLAVVLNNGNRTFQAPAIYLSAHSGDLRQINEIITGDADQDGYLDVFLANYASSTISFFRNRGDGTFERQIGIGTGPNPLDVVFGEFSGDNVGDLVAFHSAFPPPAFQNRLHLIRGLGGWTPVLADTFRLIRGRLISGGLGEIQQSDNTYMVLWPGFVLSQAEAPVQLVVEGTAPRIPAGGLRIEVEARVNTTSIQQMIDLYNFATNQWETIDTRNASTTDTLVVVEVTSNIGSYVDPSMRMVRARVRWHAPGLVLIYPWEVRVDMVRWQIRG